VLHPASQSASGSVSATTRAGVGVWRRGDLECRGIIVNWGAGIAIWGLAWLRSMCEQVSDR
jgi:hypothetical protein